MPDWLPRRLPEDVVAEASLLATCCAPGMESRAMGVVTSLSEGDFVHPNHKAVFRALKSLLGSGSEVNAITLKATLEAQGDLGSVGGFAGLTELLMSEEVGRPEQLAKLIKKHTTGRSVIKVAAKVIAEVSDGELTVEEATKQGVSGLLGALQGDQSGPKGQTRSESDVMDGYRASTYGIKRPKGVMTDLSWLNSITGGFRPGNVVVLAARPGVGKSALALQFGLSAASQGHRTGLWSLEMTQDELLDRRVAQLGYLPAGWTDRGDMPDALWAKFLEARDELKGLPLEVCDDPVISPATIRMGLMTAKAQGNPFGFAIVDYLQLMEDDDPERAKKQQEVTRIAALSRALKLIAKEYAIPIIVLSQLNREIEGRVGGAPRLSDLRDSGAIEQDADMVIFVHRERHNGDMNAEGDMTVAKNRHGRTGVHRVIFDGQRMLFREVTKQTAPPDLAPAKALF